jgi:glyoxylate reductase
MEIQYHSRHPLSPNQFAGNAKYVSFEDLLATSDVLSLNLPLTPATRHTISTAEFAKMKDGIVIVNTARGAIMNEAALADALESGKVASAGLDVYEDEPTINPRLMGNERVLLLPHMGTHTRGTDMRMEIMMINNLRAAITKGELLNPVN